jgi:hypothetical protein
LTEIQAADRSRSPGRDGVGLPRAVVDRASHARNLLHPFFTWDDGEAADQWRLEQARDLINGVKMVAVAVTRDGGEVSSDPVPVYASVRLEEGGRDYREVTVLIGSEGGRNALLREALEQLARFRNRYRVLAELADVMRAIDQVLVDNGKEDEGQ